MKYYFDTSALIKRYITESGSEIVETIFENASAIFVSAITLVECLSVIRRYLAIKRINEDDYNNFKYEIIKDFDFFEIVSLDETVQAKCIETLDEFQLKSLDTIQAASLQRIINEIDHFVVCDKQLIRFAEMKKISILTP